MKSYSSRDVLAILKENGWYLLIKGAHNSHLTLTLNAKTIRKLDEFLSSNYDDIHTHWHLIQKRWNDLYGIPKGRQQKSVAISQPNYNNLPIKQ